MANYNEPSLNCKAAPTKWYFAMMLLFTLISTACTKNSPQDSANTQALKVELAQVPLAEPLHLADSVVSRFFTLPATNELALMQKAQDLRHEGHYVEAYLVYHYVLSNFPHHFDALWQQAVLRTEQGQEYRNPRARKEHFNDGVKLAQRAIKTAPQEAGGYVAMGMALARQGTLGSHAHKMACLQKARYYASRAMAHNAQQPYAWLIEGLWHHHVAGLSKKDRVIITKLMGSQAVKGASYQKAIDAFAKSGDQLLSQAHYYLLLGQCHLALGQTALAAKHLQTATEHPVTVRTDRQYVAQAQRLLQQMQLPGQGA